MMAGAWVLPQVMVGITEASALFGGIPAADFLLILVGLPAVAAAGGWLLGGRQPSDIARQPLE